MKPTKTNMILTILITLLISSTAMGFDSGTPYTVTMNFIVPSDSTFTVTLAAAESTIDFNANTTSSKCIEPDSQSNTSSIPIINISNDGNVNTNYGINLTAGAPSWVTLKASGTAGATKCNDGTAFNSSVIWTNWNTTTPGTYANVYLFANFTSAIGGTTARTFQINAQNS
jgi:hypothetical protein